jgi:hypothetical protein
MKTIFNFFANNLAAVAAAIGLPLAGWFSSHVWTRYRDRLVELRYTSVSTPLAFATADVGWGEVEILYNKNPTKNLHVINIELQNASSRDLSNVQIDIATDEGTSVFRSAGQVDGSLQVIPFASHYNEGLMRVGSGVASSQEINNLLRRSDFFLPVLNRGAIARFRLLVSRQDYEWPHVQLGCDHAGVRIRPLPSVALHYGVRQGQAQVAGAMISAFVLAAAVVANLPSWLVGGAGLVLGWYVVFIGASVVKGGRIIGRLFD